MPIMSPARRWAWSGDLANLTPPPFPRPPEWICAFTTTRFPPRRRAMSPASAALKATSPRGTGTPCRARMALAWYSWMFMTANSHSLHFYNLHQLFHRRCGFLERGVLLGRQLDLDDLFQPASSELARHA